MKYAVVTFGCRVNQADSLGFEDDLQRSGAEPASLDAADVVIVNSCSVTCSADQGTRQTVRRVAKTNPAARILVTGCYATREPGEVAALPNVLRVIPNTDKPRFREVLDELGETTAQRFGEGDGNCGLAIEPGVAGRTAFTLRVQTGCDERCTYCIIPTTRGRAQSVEPDALIEQLRRVLLAGFKEVALTGVHLGSYGRDLTPSSSLVDLVARLAAASPPDVRFRVSSLEPMDCPPGLVELMAGDSRFAAHFHLPMQHASDRMLRAMGRPYTRRDYDDTLARIRSRMPDAAIGTDLIVGFPGENDADFAELADYLTASSLTHAHVFPYSDRPGTVAASMSDKVDGRVVRERARALRGIANELNDRFRAGQVGRQHRALTLEDGRLALTANYLKVRIPPGHPRNEWVTVRIVAAGDPMVGEVLASTSEGEGREALGR